MAGGFESVCGLLFCGPYWFGTELGIDGEGIGAGFDNVAGASVRGSRFLALTGGGKIDGGSALPRVFIEVPLGKLLRGGGLDEGSFDSVDGARLGGGIRPPGAFEPPCVRGANGGGARGC